METLTLIISIIALVIACVALNRTRRASRQVNYAPQGYLSSTPPPTLTTFPPTTIDRVFADDAPPPEILAVIAAAVTMVCGPNARIAAVRPASVAANIGAETAAQLWALEGRRTLHATHIPR